MPPSLDRLIYIDDSGHPQSGLVVFGWIEFTPDRWADVLRVWLDTRKRLWREFSIPVVQELHTTDYVNGRGRISTKVPERHIHAGHEHWKDFGREVAAECLETLRSTEGLRVGAVWRRGEPRELHRTKRETYSALITRIESELHGSDSLGMVFMDGDGSDTTYRAAHRNLKLSARRVIEDAVLTDSKHSQLVQMADLVAWSANAHIEPHRGNEFAWDWYTKFLSERDPHRAPTPI